MMIVRDFVVTMVLTAAAGTAWAQLPPAPPTAPEPVLLAAVEAQAPPAAPSPAPPQAPAPARAPAPPVPARAPQPPAPARAAQPPAAPAPPTPAPPRREGQPINVRVEVTITDKKPNAAPVTKTVTVVAGDGLRGSIRSEGSGRPGTRNTPLNVDVDPNILADNKVRVGLNLHYDMPGQSESPSSDASAFMQIRDSVTMILESGKPMMVAQSADPTSDRQVTVEVKATILR
jgi:hypothetical protein